VLHFDGSTWTGVDVSSVPTLLGMWSGGADDVWIVGESGTIVHGGRSGFVRVDSGVSANLRCVWGAAVAGGSEVWAAGEDATVLRRMGAAAFVPQSHGLTSNALFSIWLDGAGDVWVTGSSAVLHYDGRAWTAFQNGLTVGLGLWGSAGDDVWAVGASSGSDVSRFNGVAWVEAASPVATNLIAVRGTSVGNVWAVGEMGTVIHLRSP